MSRPQLADNEIVSLAHNAKIAARRLASISTEIKDQALLAIATTLEQHAPEILAANQKDLAAAAPLVATGQMAQALFDRLKLDQQKLAGMIAGVKAVAQLEDPSGRILARTRLDEGLELHKVSCPLGVLAIIFESRPDAVTQISALAIKSGNVAILKGGREAAHSTAALVHAINTALAQQAEIPANVINLVTERSDIDALLTLDNYIDLVIPRGSNDLVRYIQNHTRIPVLGHAEGICHIYIDKAANIEMANNIVYDAKTQYPAACNALETLLVHKDIAPQFLPALIARLKDSKVELRVCARTKQLMKDQELNLATELDWSTEYCALILAIKLVDSLDEAIDHIHQYGSSHTEAIITDDPQAAETFLNSVDAAGVYHNASTRFADGFRYGFGAEVGISTSKLHARGPVGLEGLISYKYKLYGSGQLVATYSGSNARPFQHEKL